jgi:hypothetical protein
MRPDDAHAVRPGGRAERWPIGRAAPAALGWLGRDWPRTRRPVLLAAVAVLALLGGASAALEIIGPDGPSVASTAAVRHPGGTGLRAGLAGPGAARSRILHGQFVRPAPGGGYQTVLIQSGVITAVSPSAITLRSADGYRRTYQVTGSTIVDARRGGIGSVYQGDSAALLAAGTGRAATAVRIRDLTLLRRAGQTLGNPH